MASGSFDPRIRMLEHADCGAILTAPVEGARLVCPGCGAPVDILLRADAPWRERCATPDDEAARLMRLAAQRESPLTAHAYDLATPPPGFTADPLRDAASSSALRSAWNAALPTLGWASVAKQRDALWLALHLANVYLSSSQPRESRALLETALSVLTDGGHQHLVRCRLSGLSVWEGDLPGAAVWLAGCDLSPEVLELDSSLREAEARLAAAGEEWPTVLEIVGHDAAGLPVAEGYARTLDLLRIRGLSAAGLSDRAFAELTRAMAHYGRESVLAELPRADAAVTQLAREEVEAHAATRDEVPTRSAAVLGELANLPYVALAALVLVTMPRCFFDADPFGGAHGHLLCPAACHDCRGPFRVHTYWDHSNGRHFTMGPDYFCVNKDNGVATMSETELSRVRGVLRPQALSVAPGALTYLSLLALLLPISLAQGLREHLQGRERRRALTADIDAMASEARVPSPLELPADAGPYAIKAGVNLGFALLASALLIAAELLVHRGMR